MLDEDVDDYNAFDYEEQQDLIVINAKSRSPKLKHPSSVTNKKNSINSTASSIVPSVALLDLSSSNETREG